MKKVHFLLLFFSFLICLPLFFSYRNTRAQELSNQTEELLKCRFQEASLGVSVIDLAKNQEVISYRSHKNMIPASVLKLVTTATALDILGPEYQIKTPFSFSGHLTSKGTVPGDIVITGQGDPSLGSEIFEKGNRERLFESIYKELEKRNIRVVKGGIVADMSAFPKENTPSKWVWEDLGNYYGASPSALAYRDNTYHVILQSGPVGSKVKVVKTNPTIPQLQLSSHVIAASNKKDSAYIFGAPFSWERQIHGTIPANRKSFSIKGSIPQPGLLLAQELTALLEKKGIKISSQPRLTFTKIEKPQTVFFTYSSPTISEIIKETNFRSLNLAAELLLRQIALNQNIQLTGKKMQDHLIMHWEKNGIPSTNCFLADGAGLSPLNAVSPEFFTGILTYIFNDKKFKEPFLASLPMAGREGTLKSLLKDTSLEGNLMAKSGSMNGVRCYAGYFTKEGKTYAFCTMLNHFNTSQKNAKKEMERILLTIYNSL